MRTSKTSVIILALWVLFVGATWAGWLTISAHSLGILSVIVGLVVLFIEVYIWHPWVKP